LWVSSLIGTILCRLVDSLYFSHLFITINLLTHVVHTVCIKGMPNFVRILFGLLVRDKRK